VEVFNIRRHPQRDTAMIGPFDFWPANYWQIVIAAVFHEVNLFPSVGRNVAHGKPKLRQVRFNRQPLKNERLKNTA
jgi:hypothetical protein